MERHGFCRHCGQRFLKKRNNRQIYCTEKACQHHRKIIWRQEKMKNDADYRANQQAANKRWQLKHGDYWRQYRAKHPEYVERNRKAQRVRDGTAHLNASHLAKSDALAEKNLVVPGTYWLTPTTEDNLAKSDALRVKILILSGKGDDESHLAKRLLYSN
jgi:hypothetical protein